MARISAAAKLEVRRKLIESAATHFASVGLERASVDAISTDAGFAKGTLYNYFSSKEELFAEVVAEAGRQVVQRYADAEPGGTARERIEALINADVDHARENRDFSRVILRETLSLKPELYALVLKHMGPSLITIADVMKQGQEEGLLRRDLAPQQLALCLLGVLAFLYVQHWGAGGAWPTFDELPGLALSLFLNGSGTQGGNQ